MRDLAVVMPVYNEAECILAVVRAWLDVLDRLGMQAVMLLYDDGSSDDTPGQLATFAGDERVRVSTHTNRGHGPTILLGYREAVLEADWVFQCDSDGEISPECFPALWAQRDQCDAVFVIRTGRKQDAVRSFMSRFSRATIRLLFGRRVPDVNAPFRLMRARWLAPVLDAIPADTFAPNLLISGAASVGEARVVALPVLCAPRQTGRSSILGLRALKVATRSFLQTLRARRAVRAAALVGERERGHATDG